MYQSLGSYNESFGSELLRVWEFKRVWEGYSKGLTGNIRV